MGKQMTEDKQRKGVLKVNEYILYERNISSFFNSALHQLYDICLNKKSIRFSNDLFHRLLFCLAKNQLIQSNKIDELLKNSHSQSFKEQIWDNYIKSDECKKSKLRIQNDIKENLQLFDEILAKAVTIL